MRRARFKTVRQSGIGRLFKGDALDHIAAALIGRHGFQQPPFAIEHADSSRAIEFMTRKDIKIGIERLHIGLAVCDPLRPVDQH